MFKIKAKNDEVLTVYNVNLIKGMSFHTKFLIYDGTWKWVDAEDFEPFE